MSFYWTEKPAGCTREPGMETGAITRLGIVDKIWLQVLEEGGGGMMMSMGPGSGAVPCICQQKSVFLSSIFLGIRVRVMQCGY